MPLSTCTHVADFQHGRPALQTGPHLCWERVGSAAPTCFLSLEPFVILFVRMLAPQLVWELLACNRSHRLQHGCLQFISLQSLKKKLLISHTIIDHLNPSAAFDKHRGRAEPKPDQTCQQQAGGYSRSWQRVLEGFFSSFLSLCCCLSQS